MYKLIKKYVYSLQYVYMITNRIPFDHVDKIVELVTLYDVGEWIRKRYRKQNYKEVIYMLEESGVCLMLDN